MLLILGARTYELASRALVIGILPATPDRDGLLGRAEEAARAGADVLEVGGAGLGEAEELERVVAAVAAVHDRVGVPVAVATGRAPVAAEAYRAGAVLGVDRSGFAHPGYAAAAAAAGAAVVVGGGDGLADPEGFLAARVAAARAAGVGEGRIAVDAGVEGGKASPRARRLLAGSGRLAGLGVPVALSVTAEDFPGEAGAVVAAHAAGGSLGARILRAHDVVAARRVRDALAAVLEAR